MNISLLLAKKMNIKLILLFVLSIALLIVLLYSLGLFKVEKVLPHDFKSCVKVGGSIRDWPEWQSLSGTVCSFGIWQSENSKLYRECKSMGGGTWVAEAGIDTPEDYGCRLHFSKEGEKCFGGFCD